MVNSRGIKLKIIYDSSRTKLLNIKSKNSTLVADYSMQNIRTSLNGGLVLACNLCIPKYLQLFKVPLKKATV